MPSPRRLPWRIQALDVTDEIRRLYPQFPLPLVIRRYSAILAGLSGTEELRQRKGANSHQPGIVSL